MYGLAIFLVLAIVLFVLLMGTPSDCASPLNFAMYQAPSAKYTDQLVNMWVNKGWRTDGSRIPCRLESGSDPDLKFANRTVIVYSHGNAENVLLCHQFVRELSHSLKVDVVSYDYSGYGLNPGSKRERTVEGVNLTLRTVMEHLSEMGYRYENMILWGYSLGTGPSTYLAAEKPVRALVLLAAYSSILDVVRDTVGEKAASLFEERWDTKDRIGSVECPIMLLHGQSDGLIGHEHSALLQSRNKEKAKLVLLPNTGHTQFAWSEVIGEVQKWLAGGPSTNKD